MATAQVQKPILYTEHLTRVVAGRPLVNDVNIQVACGDVVAIVGPSGAGKSSFLRLLNRLDEPTAGTVYLDGQDYRQIPPRELRCRVSMVMQTPYLFPGTVGDNIAFGPRQRGQEMLEARIQDLLDRVGLAGYGERDVHTLSGGEAQRVSLARTLANQPEVLLLDEPTSALDETTEHEVEQLICQIIRQQELTCLMITHDTDQATRMANRILEFRGGQLVRSDVVEEVLGA